MNIRFLVALATLGLASACSGGGSMPPSARLDTQAAAVEPAPDSATPNPIAIEPKQSPIFHGAGRLAETVSEAGYSGGFTMQLDASEPGPNMCKATNGFGGGDPGTCRSVPSNMECDDTATGGSILFQSPTSSPSTTFTALTVGPVPKIKFYCAIDYVDANGRYHRSTATWYPA